MNAWTSVFRKELRDALRDRRSLLSALLFPLLGPLLVAAMFAYLSETQSDDEPVHVVVEGAEHAPALVRFLEARGATVAETTLAPRDAIRDGERDLVLSIAPTFEEDFRAGRPAPIEILIDTSRLSSATAWRRARGLLSEYAAGLGSLRLLARGMDPELIRPIDLRVEDLATPQRSATTFLNVVPLLLVLAGFIGGMYVATDTTAGERERGSLEPLLTTPVSRLALAGGKWAATASFAAAAALLTATFMRVALAFVPLERLGVAFDLGLRELGLAVAVLLPLAGLAAALELLVATFARSFKEAQTYLSLMMFAPMLPGIVLSLGAVTFRSWMATIPAFGQHLLLLDIMRGEPLSPWDLGLAAAATLALTTGCVIATARLLGRETIVFGR